MTATLAEIRRVASEARPALQSLDNCGYINNNIANALRDELGIECEYYEGSAAHPDSRQPPIDEHAFVRIPPNEVDDVTTEVRVDGSIDQFCDANKDDLFFFLIRLEE